MTHEIPYVAPTVRALTLDDVYRIVGMLTMELDQIRRENAALRAQIQNITSTGPLSHDHDLPVRSESR